MNNHLKRFYNDFGNYKNMVLSTTCENKVHSRMMSIVLIENKFYFQTDKHFLKCCDIKTNLTQIIHHRQLKKINSGKGAELLCLFLL